MAGELGVPIRIVQRVQPVAVVPKNGPQLTLVHASAVSEGPVPSLDVVASASVVVPLVPRSRAQDFPVPELPPAVPNLLKSLNDLWHERKNGDLFMVSRETLRMYRVVWYDGETGKVKLVSSTGLDLTPTVTEREEEKYFAQWRTKAKS